MTSPPVLSDRGQDETEDETDDETDEDTLIVRPEGLHKEIDSGRSRMGLGSPVSGQRNLTAETQTLCLTISVNEETDSGRG